MHAYFKKILIVQHINEDSMKVVCMLEFFSSWLLTEAMLCRILCIKISIKVKMHFKRNNTK